MCAILRDCVKEVLAERGFDTDSSVGKFVNKVAVRSDVRPKLEKREVLGGVSSSEVLGASSEVVGASSKGLGASSEVLEVINSFRTPFSIPIVRMEQVGLYLNNIFSKLLPRWILNQMRRRRMKKEYRWNILNQRMSNILLHLHRNLCMGPNCKKTRSLRSARTLKKKKLDLPKALAACPGRHQG